jgi:hypothetical protein
MNSTRSPLPRRLSATLTFVALASALLLAACGGGGSAGSTPAAPAADPTDQAIRMRRMDLPAATQAAGDAVLVINEGSDSAAPAPEAVQASTCARLALALPAGRPVASVVFASAGWLAPGWDGRQHVIDVPFDSQGPVLQVRLPARTPDLPAGPWMLFTVDDAGVASAAHLAAPGQQPAQGGCAA